jgi:hypothetical protein
MMNDCCRTRPRRRSSRRLAILTSTTVVGLAVAGIIVSPVARATTILPNPTPPPGGGDSGWEALAQSCYNGSMRACDSLADQTKAVNAPVYQDYGFSCGGRVTYQPGSAATGAPTYVYCLDQYPDHP